MADRPDGALPWRPLALVLAGLAAVVTVVVMRADRDTASTTTTTTTSTAPEIPDAVQSLPAWDFPGAPPPFEMPVGGSVRMASAAEGPRAEIRRGDGTLLAVGDVDQGGDVGEVRYYDTSGELTLVISPVAASLQVRARRGVVRCGADSRANAGYRWTRFPIPWRANLTGLPARITRAGARGAFLKARRNWGQNENHCRIRDRSRVAFALRGSTRARVARDGVNTLSFGNVDRLGGSCVGALACAITFTQGSAARESDILLDRTPSGGWFTAGRFRRNGIDVESAATHETGHMLGFAHVRTRSNIMFARVTRGDVSGRRLGRGDANQNNARY